MITKKKVLAIIILFGLFAVAWAAGHLAQSNKLAADSGAISSDMAMANLESIKPSVKTPNCNWGLESRLRGQLQSQNKAYNNILKQAQNEVDRQDEVSANTASRLMQAAEQFKATSDKYGRMWDDCNCTTRAKLAYEAGNSLAASAKVVAYGANSDNADALEDAQERMNEARQAYVEEAVANNELSAADKAKLKSSLLPRAQAMVTDTAALSLSAVRLLDNIRSQVSPSGVIGAMTGCISSGRTQVSSPEDEVAALLGPVTSLASLARGLGASAGSLVEDIMLLIK